MEEEFENALSGYRHHPLPPDWKREILDAASQPDPSESKAAIQVGLFTKVSLALVAACWIAIAFLTVTMPATESPSSMAQRPQVQPEQVPLIAQLLKSGRIYPVNPL